MFKSNKILGFIGARAGSKGLKNKNILPLDGKPLINHTIQASLNSKYIDYTLVSTDSKKIATIAKMAGAHVPFFRPKELATDKAAVVDAIDHCLHWLKINQNKTFDYVLSLQPTSPLRSVKDIDKAIEYYFNERKNKEDTLVSVYEAPQKCGWLLNRDDSGYIHFCFDISNDKIVRQGLPKYYLPNGAIYLAPIHNIKEKSFYTHKTIPFIMPKEKSIDIDTQEDFDRAKKALKK